MENDDFRAIAQGATRKGFVSTCRFCFLLARGELHPPKQPRPTEVLARFDPDDESTMTPKPADYPTQKATPTQVLAIRKVQATFPDMITVGRTANNDVVVTDISVSRFHAFFQVQGETVALADAGSLNGTKIDGTRLAPRGPATPLESGSQVSFGDAEFYFLDAGSLWDRLHRR